MINHSSKTILLTASLLFTNYSIQTISKDSSLSNMQHATVEKVSQIISILTHDPEDNDEMFEKINTVTWKAIVPAIIAYYAAHKTSCKLTHEHETTCKKLSNTTLATLAAVAGGGSIYLLRSLPKEVLKTIIRELTVIKKSLPKKFRSVLK